MSVKSNKTFKIIDENLTKESHESNKSEISHISHFLSQLYQILADKNNENIIHWDDNGKYFIIENMYDFTEKILPKYYNHNNFASFVRQLNKYNFHKIKTSIHDNAFQNNQFIKGKKELISNILRKKKRKRDIDIGAENNITSLVKYKKNNYLYDINNIGGNNENNNNFSIDKRSLSLEEGNDNCNNNSVFYNKDYREDNHVGCNSNINYTPFINKQINQLLLKQNLMDESTHNKIDEQKKISKKTVNDLLNDIVNKTEKNSKRQKMLNAKIDSLSNKNLEYINKNKNILMEIESNNDNSKRLEKFISFILEVKNMNRMKNRLLPDNMNNYNKSDSNESLLNNIDIINSAEKSKEENNEVNSKEYNNEKANKTESESFQTFFNKYFERKKNEGLLISSENNSNSFNLEKKNSNSILLSKNSNNIYLDNNLSKINESIFKDKSNLEAKNSIDNLSSIFKRKRSSSFQSSFSNNVSDNLNNNDNIFYTNSNQNDYNINNRSEIIWNNKIDSNNITNNFNKSFDGDLSQDKNINRKDSLNNSSYSFIDIPNK